MKKFKVLFSQNCLLETTIIVEGNFPKDEDEREEAIVELASEELLPIEELMKGNGTDHLIMGNCMDIIVKELD